MNKQPPIPGLEAPIIARDTRNKRNHAELKGLHDRIRHLELTVALLTIQIEKGNEE